MSDITAISPYLVIIAEHLRPDWDSDVLADAILATGTAGWAPARLLREFARLIADPDSGPRDLTYLAASPVRREPAVSRARNVPEYAAFREQLDAIPPLPEHRSGAA